MTKPADASNPTTPPGHPSAQPHAGAAGHPFNPFAMPFALPMPEIFGQMVRDQITRTQAIMAELAIHEGLAVQRARTAVDELARLTGDSLGYVGQLASEWRKLSLDAVQRTAESFAPRA